jgi:uncharacterized protein (TIGR04255 family)
VPIQVPEVSLDHLDDAPLKVALVQIRYLPVHAVEKPERVADFEALLPDSYVAQPRQISQGFSFQIGGGLEGAPLPIPPETMWPFRDEERGWALSLSSSSIGLESIERYQHFPDFLSELEVVLAALAQTFSPKLRTRIGLRYVNQIEDSDLLQGGGLKRFLNPDLISPIGGAFGDGLVAGLSEMRFAEQDGTFVVRHGLVTPTTYLLDFDYFHEEEVGFDVGETKSRVSRFHDLIERVFVWSLSEPYLARLQGQH